MNTIKENNTRIVARLLATGVKLEDICDNLGLNLATWRTIVSGPIFKAALTQLHNEIDEKVIEETSTDPVYLKLKMAGAKAAETLVKELDSYDPSIGASAATRLKAADGILSRIGYVKMETPKELATLKIEITGSKADSLKASTIPVSAPDNLKA